MPEIRDGGRWKSETAFRTYVDILGAQHVSAQLRLQAHSEVIDFLNVHLTTGYTWPTFNIADSAIVVGVVVLMADVFLHDPDAERTDADGADELMPETSSQAN